MKIRTYAAVMAIAALPLVSACGSQGTAERADVTKAEKADKSKVDCTSQRTSQAEWMKNCAEDAGQEEAPETELKLGDAFKYEDGVKVTITRVEKFTNFAEYDSKPTSDETAFRVHVKITNGSKRPLSLDDLSVNISGATKGGDAEFTTWENGAAEMMGGRVAPGVTTNKTEDGVLKTKYGTQALVSVYYLSDDPDVDALATDPNWTGPIR